MPRVMFIMEIRSSFQILRCSIEGVPGGGQVLLMQPPLMRVCTREPQRGSKIHFATSLDTTKTSRERMRRLAGYSSMHRYQGLGGTVGACNIFALAVPLLLLALIVHMSGCSTASFLRLLDRTFLSSRACGREETIRSR